ncbi:DnaB-like helicase C-terminal domain-containing protein [Selenomonas sp. AE3005]|uniref:replicative DNA helicase n=1 Tax=Selenomonas sp. AE3005 TaxID=1485543 RepID=UPI000480276A|nr:DnaB-like helicase C-terminal domain-containing protein [Selenomonas sp. AE3005]
METKKSYSVSDTESEEMILSVLMNGKKHEVDYIFEQIKPQDFYWEGHRQLFNLFLGMYAKGEELSLISALKLYRSQIEQIQTKSSIVEINSLYVTRTMGGQWVGSNVQGFITGSVKAVKKKRAYRELIAMQNKITTDIQNDVDPDKICTEIEKALMAREPLTAKRSYLTPEDMGKLMLDAVAERMDKERRNKEVIFTSFKMLNKYTGGLEKSDLIILSAGSGVGKSTFAMNIVRDVAYVSDKAVLYLNSEMSDKQQARRYAALLSGVSHGSIRNGIDPNFGGFEKIVAAAETFAKKKIYTVTIPDLQLTNVVAEIRRMVDRFGVELVVVDYIGRMDTMSLKDLQEWQMMEQSARVLKTTAQELGIVIVMVAQLSSNGQTLAKGSSMKNEADLWLNLRRVEPDEIRDYVNADEVGLWNMLLEFRKARNVESGAIIPLHFHGDTLAFTDDKELALKYVKEEEEPAPNVNDGVA